MKVLFAIERLGRGGAERHVLDLSTALSRTGHNSIILAREGPLAVAGSEQIHLVPDGRRFFGWLRPMLMLCRSNGFDVIHVHSIAPLLAAVLVGRIYRLPVIYSVHGWNTNTHQHLPRVIKLFKPNVVIAVSDDLGKHLAQLGVNSVVVRNGVPDRNPAGLTVSSSQCVTQLLCVGRIDEPKNHRALVEVACLLRASGLVFELHLLGEGSLTSEVKSLIAYHKLNDTVKMHGFVDPAPYYRNATCAVSTSSVEGLSLAYIEALQWGLPLIVTDTSGSGLVVDDGRNGFIVPQNDPASFRDRVIQVVNGDFANMGKASRALYESKFTHDKMVLRILQCYVNSIVSQRPGCATSRPRRSRHGCGPN